MHRPISGPPQPGVVRSMLQAAPHRGRREAVLSEGRVALGTTTDDQLGDAGTATLEGWAAALVGSLDNQEELMAELRASGREISEPSSARVALEGFRVWGSEAADRFRGAFAGAVTDGALIWCFRDHLGFRPLTWREDAAGFFAASEAKQVAAGAGIGRQPNVEAVEAIFFGQPVEESAIRGVRRLMPASVLSAPDAAASTVRRYWDPSHLVEAARLSGEEASLQLTDLIDQAVRRCVSGHDVVSLSGGIDSPTVASFAAPAHLERSGQPLWALSTVYPEHPSVDESEYVKLLAEYLDIPLDTYTPQAGRLDRLDFWVDLADGPWEALPVAEVEEFYLRARHLGQTVLTGEMFEYVLGSSSYLLGHLLLHGRVRALGRLLRDLRQRGRGWRTIATALLFSGAPSLGRLYARLGRGRPRTSAVDWIDSSQIDFPAGERRSVPARRRWAENQLWGTRGHGITIEVDELCAAYCGVQVRRPLADVDLWEFLLSLPAEVKFPDTFPKRLVRQAMRGRLPDTILDRTDKTFFDAHVLDATDHEALQRWIFQSDFRLRGIRYEVLAERLQGGDISAHEMTWVDDLARVHAFMGLW